MCKRWGGPDPGVYCRSGTVVATPSPARPIAVGRCHPPSSAVIAVAPRSAQTLAILSSSVIAQDERIIEAEYHIEQQSEPRSRLLAGDEEQELQSVYTVMRLRAGECNRPLPASQRPTPIKKTTAFCTRVHNDDNVIIFLE